MAHAGLIVALSVAIASLPVAAAATSQMDPAAGAPPAGPSARYCMKIEAPTGTRIEPVRCWTREEWAEQGVDVDKDWAEEGLRVIA